MTDVFVVDDKNPEDLAMLQALYSRSPASVVTHLEKLAKSGSGKFMEQYYVGYGHSSIGDCGTTTCFIEQVSMLVAKAVQDNPMYSGQEASTRYLDFSQQSVKDPYDHDESALIQTEWMRIYNETLSLLVKGLEVERPFDANEYKSEKIWQNTLKARAFDIARSLLPIGTTTLLSWTTSLRQARDNLRRLKHHPLPEVQAVAKQIFAEIVKRYPNSFKGDELDNTSTERDVYSQTQAEATHFVDPDQLVRRFRLTDDELNQMAHGSLVARRDALDLKGIAEFEGKTLSLRPAWTPLPWRLESYGKYNLFCLLDFGSFRDIQRHRNGVCQIPVIDGRFGIHPWYLAEFERLMGKAENAKLVSAIGAQWARIKNLSSKGIKTNKLLDQYLYPMGTMGLVQLSYSVPQTVYVGELRSGKTVHPSLRPVAQAMLSLLKQDLPMIALYGDMEANDWSAKRGTQTIMAKATS